MIKYHKSNEECKINIAHSTYCYLTLNTDQADTTPEILPKQSRIISKVLSPAVRLWLRSQVEQVSNLEVEISGSDRSLLAGQIERISISATRAVYQGLHLSQLTLVGQNIWINLSQVLRGKPLRLLKPVSVTGELLLDESDLNTSLRSPLLTNALTELLTTLLPTTYTGSQQLSCHKITINNEQLIINATLATDTINPKLVVISTGLQLSSCHELQLVQPQIQTEVGFSSLNLDNFKFDLGKEVDIQELTLVSGQLIFRGRINVLP